MADSVDYAKAEYSRRYAETHKEQRRAYYVANREKILARGKEYRRTHKEETRFLAHKHYHYYPTTHLGKVKSAIRKLDEMGYDLIVGGVKVKPEDCTMEKRSEV